MASAQLSPEIDQDIKPNISAAIAATEVNSGIVTNSNGKGLRSMSNTQNTNFQMEASLDEQAKASKGTEDVSHVTVDAYELAKSSDNRVAEKEDPDATECSSSFTDSMCGNENCSGLSDAEVESQFYGDSSLISTFDGFNCVFPTRKKKLTTHWRRFICPLMWRCKWTELRINELESHASKYAKEISKYDEQKHLSRDQFTAEEFGSKSLPYSLEGHRGKVMKRRKRKRVEDTTDITSYMSNHNLFSYIANKRSDPDGTSIADDFGYPATEQNTLGHDEFGTSDGWLFLEGNNNFLDATIQKIEIIHSRVHKLKAQLDLVMSKNAAKFSSFENLSHLVSCDAQTSSVRSPTFSTCNGDTISVGGLCTPAGHATEYDTGDKIMLESAVSNYGEATPIPDIIESTVGLLSSVDVTQIHPQTGDSSEDIVDNILIHNQAAEEERHYFDNHSQPMDNLQEPERSGEEEITLPAIEMDSLAKPSVPQEQLVLGSCLTAKIQIPKNKRKRGERKAGSGNWSRQRPGEPDSK